jgi:DNA mismatch repair ATPase MutS
MCDNRQVADKSTVIDPQTAEHIELMTCLGDKKSKLSLFGVMNHCLTKGETCQF